MERLHHDLIMQYAATHTYAEGLQQQIETLTVERDAACQERDKLRHQVAQLIYDRDRLAMQIEKQSCVDEPARFADVVEQYGHRAPADQSDPGDEACVPEPLTVRLTAE